jgi:hypothetical protein
MRTPDSRLADQPGGFRLPVVADRVRSAQGSLTAVTATEQGCCVNGASPLRARWRSIAIMRRGGGRDHGFVCVGVAPGSMSWCTTWVTISVRCQRDP